MKKMRGCRGREKREEKREETRKKQWSKESVGMVSSDSDNCAMWRGRKEENKEATEKKPKEQKMTKKLRPKQ